MPETAGKCQITFPSSAGSPPNTGSIGGPAMAAVYESARQSKRGAVQDLVPHGGKHRPEGRAAVVSVRSGKPTLENCHLGNGRPTIGRRHVSAGPRAFSGSRRAVPSDHARRVHTHRQLDAGSGRQACSRSEPAALRPHLRRNSINDQIAGIHGLGPRHQTEG